MNVGVIATAFAFVLSSGSTYDACHYIPPEKSIGYCVKVQAKRLEKSGESADAVATAAINACEHVRLELNAKLLECGVKSSDLDEINSVADRAARNIAVSVVVEIRAKRSEIAKSSKH